MRLAATYEAELAETVSIATGATVIEKGERVRLTFRDDMAVGAHASGARMVTAPLREVLGAILVENED